ncbi:MAG: glutaredoxin [Myxococcota bacterium]
MHTPPPTPDRDRELILYQSNYCPFCRRVTQMLDELGDAASVEVRDTMVPEHRHALWTLTGRTQIPCLLIDGEPLFESLDINAWLGAYAARGAV